MSDENKGISIINAELPESIDNAVKNLTDKPSLSIGQTVSDLWQLVFGLPISYAAEKRKLKYAQSLEKYRARLEQKVSRIPEDKQVEPPLQVAAQALEDSKYCIDSDKLREMFVNLISNSMHADYSQKIHPSFSKIIQQLSTADARMLAIIAAWQYEGGLAIVNYIAMNVNDPRGYEIVAEKIPMQTPAACDEEAASRCIDSLLRFGLVTIPGESHFLNDIRYTTFNKSPYFEKLMSQASAKKQKIDIQKRILRLTALGQDFVSVCLG